MSSNRKVGHQWQANHIIINILEKSKHQDDFIFENTRGICTVINEDGTIYKANHELAQLLDVPISNIRQYSIKTLFKIETWDKFVKQIRLIETDSNSKHSSFEIVTDALETVKQKCFLFEIYSYGQYKNLNINFYFILGSDITSLRTAENKLKDQIEENKKLVRIITHDLANPITVIDMLSRNMHRSKLDISIIQRKLLRSSETIKEILSSVRNLQSIIDGVKKITLANHSVDQLIAETIVLFDEKLNEKKLEIIFLPSHLDVLIEAKTLRNQVLANLLSNAIKFAFPNGKIIISTEDVGDFVIIKIHDTGMGIRAESLPKLFIISQNCSTTGTSGEKGTGYGLPICKSILELMGGSISVESKFIEDDPIHHGTTFLIRLQKSKISKSA